MRIPSRLALAIAAPAIAVLALTAGCAGPAGDTPGGGANPAAPTGAGAVAATGADQLAFTATTLDGRPFAGESLRGKPGVLWFWAPWCTVCMREAPTVAKAAAANPGVTFLGVSARDELPAMTQFVTDHQLAGFAHLNDPDAAVWRRFGVTNQPAYAFVAKDGSVEVVTQRLSEQELTAKLQELSRP